MVHAFPIKILVLAAWLSTVLYVQLRGQVRHKLKRLAADHANVLAPYNTLMYVFSAVRAKPYADVSQFPELQPITSQWQMIRDEALKLFDEGYIRSAASHNDIGFNTFFRTGWKRFYLKWYGDFLPSAAALCPRTTELLAKVPSVNAAMFTLLPPGSRLGAHRDPFAGSLRYHLGLVTPNSPECFIVVDGEKYYWKDGEAVMFDETYIHTAENRTDVTRVILFCDVERPLSNPIIRAINRTLGRTMIKAAATQNVPGEHVGALNRVFEYVDRCHREFFLVIAIDEDDGLIDVRDRYGDIDEFDLDEWDAMDLVLCVAPKQADGGDEEEEEEEGDEERPAS